MLRDATGTQLLAWNGKVTSRKELLLVFVEL